MVVEEVLTLGGGHAMLKTDDVSQNCTLETYIILLTNITPMNLIKNRTKKWEKLGIGKCYGSRERYRLLSCVRGMKGASICGQSMPFFEGVWVQLLWHATDLNNLIDFNRYHRSQRSHCRPHVHPAKVLLEGWGD